MNKKHVIGYTTTALVALVIGVSAGGAGSDSSAATTNASGVAPNIPTITKTVEGPAVTVTKASTPAPAATTTTEAATEEAPSGDTCENAREAILTGTPAEINKAMKALVADKKADSTAREYARYYLGRDKHDADMREMDISLIQMSCSI